MQLNLTYAGENEVKDAQYQLHLLYSNEQYIPVDLEKVNIGT